MTEYAICDPSGALIATHVRQDEPEGGKRMYWRLPDGELGLGGLPASELPLYGIARDLGRSVVVTEGEKACDALLEAGISAVGTVTGASSTPSAAVLGELAGKVAYLWPDADDPGHRHMERMAERLAPIAASVRWIEPGPDRAKGWDAADAIAELGAEQVRELIRGAVDAREFLSSGPDAPAERMSLPFVTGAQLAAETPATWEYLAEPYIALGMIHELDGKPKVAGKTTLLLHLIAAVLDGRPFLGRPTMRSAVVLLTEQTRRSLAPTLRVLGLDRDELLILTWPDATGTSWPEIVAASVAECRRMGARLLVIDTLAPFVGLGAEMENDAAAALAAMRPLQAAAQEHDLAILLSRHDRKSGGDVAESGRGSNAWSGAVDCVIALRRQPNPVRPTIRELEAISRRGDVPEEAILLELTEAGYVVLGDSAAVAFTEARDRVLECLSVQPDGPLNGQTLDELAEATERTRPTTRRAVLALAASGVLERTGKGRAGDPYRYSLTPSSARSVQRSPLRGEPVLEQTAKPEAADLVDEARRVFGDMLAPATPTDLSAMVPRIDA